MPEHRGQICSCFAYFNTISKFLLDMSIFSSLQQAFNNLYKPEIDWLKHASAKLIAIAFTMLCSYLLIWQWGVGRPVIYNHLVKPLHDHKSRESGDPQSFNSAYQAQCFTTCALVFPVIKCMASVKVLVMVTTPEWVIVSVKCHVAREINGPSAKHKCADAGCWLCCAHSSTSFHSSVTRSDVYKNISQYI